MDLQQRMQCDLGFLKQAFPHLQEQFPKGAWHGRVEQNLFSGYHVAFWIEDADGDPVSLVSIMVMFLDEKLVYSLALPVKNSINFPTIYAAVEFIGRKAHALTPIDASAEALEARFGGES